MIPPDVIRQVRERTDLVRLITEHLPLRRAGRNHMGLCPFHSERTPSFAVSADLGVYICHGCKASGDAITFLQEREGMRFAEAVETLAERLGIVFEPDVDPAVVAEKRRARDARGRLYAAAETAAAFYEEALWSAGAGPEAAREALAARGVGEETARAFRLGYAPATWDALLRRLAAAGISPADAELAGLLQPRRGGGSGWHDRFRHRLMFPVSERDGKVVAFSGRLLAPFDGMPEGLVPEDAGKYINTPETPLYTKGAQLYGLAQARPALRESPKAVLVEGNFDVVQMHAHGFTATVGMLGSFFSKDQARLLRRFAEEVTFLFDPDAAGRKAVAPAYASAAAARLIARVASLPTGLDPDGFLRRGGGADDALRDLLEAAPGAVEWQIKAAAAAAGGLLARRVVALREVAPMMARVVDDIERAVHLEAAARAFGIDRALVTRAVADAFRAAEKEAAADGVVPAEKPAAPSAATPSPSARTAAATLEPAPGDGAEQARRLFGVAVTDLLAVPSVLDGPEADVLFGLAPEPWRPFVATAIDLWRERGALDAHALLADAPSDKARAWVAERLLAQGSESLPDEQAAELKTQRQQGFATAVERMRRLAAGEAAREAARALADAGPDVESLEAMNRVLDARRRVEAPRR